MNATNQEIEAVRVIAKEEGKTPLELITFLQSAAAKIGDEKTLSKLCLIKRTFIDEIMAA